jgi:hypothetical protein
LNVRLDLDELPPMPEAGKIFSSRCIEGCHIQKHNNRAAVTRKGHSRAVRAVAPAFRWREFIAIIIDSRSTMREKKEKWLSLKKEHATD